MPRQAKPKLLSKQRLRLPQQRRPLPRTRLLLLPLPKLKRPLRSSLHLQTTKLRPNPPTPDHCEIYLRAEVRSFDAHVSR